MGVGTRSQETRSLFLNEIDKFLVLPPGPAFRVLGPVQGVGFSQIRGGIISINPCTVTFQSNIMNGFGLWNTDFVLAVPALVYTPFVVDIVGDYQQILVTDVGGLGGLAQMSADLYPISDLASNRAPPLPPIVIPPIWTNLGANGWYAPVLAPPSPGPPIIAIPANPLGRRSATLRNFGARNCFWGYDALLTINNGMPLRPQESYTWKETTAGIWVLADVGVGNVDCRAEEQQV